MTRQVQPADLSGLYPAAMRQSFAKLDPRSLWKNPVMFVTAVVAALTTVLGLRDLLNGTAGAGTSLHIGMEQMAAHSGIKFNHVPAIHIEDRDLEHNLPQVCFSAQADADAPKIVSRSRAARSGTSRPADHSRGRQLGWDRKCHRDGRAVLRDVASFWNHQFCIVIDRRSVRTGTRAAVL